MAQERAAPRSEDPDEAYRWRLERHLLPFFADRPHDEITFDLVERDVAGKLAETRPLSPRSINMTVTLAGRDPGDRGRA